MLISLKVYEHEGKVFGQYYEDENVYLFFGNKNFESEHFRLFPHVQFQFLKQVHGNNVIYFDRFTEELHHADGHFTATKNLGLVIQTADCLPILVYDQHQKWIMGLHAGWRGVVNKVTKEGIMKFRNESRSPLLSIFVGPHIQYKSFEVDEDVAMQLKRCTELENENYMFDESKKKYFINLKKIVHSQVLETSMQIQELYISGVDTFTNDQYSSFRRQKGPCRNYSFIYLK